MRVVLVSSCLVGHWMPMLPLAHALKRRGHGVEWAIEQQAHPAIEQRGYVAHRVGQSHDEYRARLHAQWPQRHTLTARQQSEELFGRLFGGVIAPAVLADLIALFSRLRPDLVIHDAAALAAPLACRSTGTVHVAHAFGLQVPAAIMALAMERFASCRVPSCDDEPRDGTPDGYVDMTPGPLRMPQHATPQRCPMIELQPAAGENHRGTLPTKVVQVLESAKGPRVYLTFGTVFNGAPALQAGVDALLCSGASVVVSGTSASQVATGSAACSRLAVVDWVDQGTLLPHCDFVMSHGGAGTVLGAAARGLPQVCLPQGADHFRNAEALEHAGMAVVVEPEVQNQRAIAEAFDLLRSDRRFLKRATACAASVAQMPPPSQAARHIEELHARRVR
jgi:UDP:flavonoid glycosyltransferase YjiC (YdhE family)